MNRFVEAKKPLSIRGYIQIFSTSRALLNLK
ncbi:MAG: hypothetical protein ACI9IJ_001843, partial [Psychromonas sp.]